MTPPKMTDEQIQEFVGTVSVVEFAKSIIAARDKQWSELLGEPVGVHYAGGTFFTKTLPNATKLYAPKQEKLK